MRYLLVILLFLPFSACSSGPVRHLASDISLIESGKSTRQDVYGYLGEPDATRQLDSGCDELLYKEDSKDFLKKVPVVDSWIGEEGYEMAVITICNDLVTDYRLKSFNSSNYKWVNQFDWQENK